LKSEKLLLVVESWSVYPLDGLSATHMNPSPSMDNSQSPAEEQFQICENDLTDDRLTLYLQESMIAVDTETMGLIPGRDRLCLVQLCDLQGRVTVIPIQQGQTSAPHLQLLLENIQIEKIAHFARFDMATLRYHLGIRVTPIFCTKIASRLARTYSSQHGLKALVQELIQVELDKTSQSSDWGSTTNLTEHQLRYAANDVRYLARVRDHLSMMLKREGRWQLAQECFQCLPSLVSLDLLQYNGVFDH